MAGTAGGLQSVGVPSGAINRGLAFIGRMNRRASGREQSRERSVPLALGPPEAAPPVVEAPVDFPLL